MTLDAATSLVPALPEALLAAGICALVVVGAAGPRGARTTALLVGFAACAAAAIATITTSAAAPRTLWHGLVARDALGDFFKLLVCAGTAAALALFAVSKGLGFTTRDEDAGRDAPELVVLLLGVALGAVVLASARNLLLAYLALELVSVASYLLTGLSRGSRRSAEAALKYVVYGGVASAAMLYGTSLLYGLARSLDFDAVRTAAAAGPALAVAPAVVLVLAGIGYKMAVAPFHMWCPDVYEGAPTPVTAFLSVVPKAAGFGVALRLVGPTSAPPLALLLLLVAVLTMTLGNLAALGQRNVKRLLAYSSIAQAGYLLLGVAAGGSDGTGAVLFHLAVYLFLSYVAFAAVAAFADAGCGETLDGWAGLGARAPLPSLALALALIGLVGLPPTAGFVGKYQLFAAAWARAGAGPGTGAFAVAALIGVLNSALSLAYYAKILRQLYLVPAAGASLPMPWRTALITALALPILLLGLYGAPLLGATATVVALP